MPPDTCQLVTVPRQAFTGWFLAVRAYQQAGLSDVVFTFAQRELHLLAYWGETRMPYEGEFTGRVRIAAQRMLTLAKKGEKMLTQPVPITLKLFPERRRLGVDLFEVPAQIEPIWENQLAKPPPPLHTATAVGFTIMADELLRLIKKVSPNRPGKRDAVKVTACATGLTVQTAKGVVKQDASVVGAGAWTMSLDVILKALDSYPPSTLLTIEAEAGKMRMNSFHLPVLAWEAMN